MRITEDTPSRLVLRDRTWWIALFMLGVAMVLLSRGAMVRDWHFLISATLFLVFGLLSLRGSEIVFDKMQRLCSLRRLDMVRVTRLTLPFREIRDIQVEVEPQADSHTALCRFSLVTASAAIPLTIAYEPDPERYNKMRETVLDVVFAGARRLDAVDPIRDLVKRGRIVAAVGLLRQRDGLDLVTARARIDDMQKTLGR
jgi:hypothetical protein